MQVFQQIRFNTGAPSEISFLIGYLNPCTANDEKGKGRETSCKVMSKDAIRHCIEPISCRSEAPPGKPISMNKVADKLDYRSPV